LAIDNGRICNFLLGWAFCTILSYILSLGTILSSGPAANLLLKSNIQNTDVSKLKMK
jgi:hypothetical protein